MKLTLTPAVLRNIDLFEKVLDGMSVNAAAASVGITGTALRTGFRQLYRYMRDHASKHTDVPRDIDEPRKYDIYLMRINRKYWHNQVKHLKIAYGLK